MTLIVIVTTCIVLIITRLIYQYRRNISIAFYIKPILGFLVILQLILVAIIVNKEARTTQDTSQWWENYTIAIDISESMKSDVLSEWGTRKYARSDLAQDYAKELIWGLLRQDASCHINIIVFWGRSFEVVSPTNQKNILIQGVEKINPDMVNREQDGYDGSDIAQILLLSQTLQKLHGGVIWTNHKTIIVTDGDHNRWVDVYEIMRYISHPIFILPIGSSSGEIFTIHGAPEKKIDGNPVILTTNTKLLSDITKISWWNIWDTPSSILNSLKTIKSEQQNIFWSIRLIERGFIVSTILLFITYLYLLRRDWYIHSNIILWILCLGLCLFLSALVFLSTHTTKRSFQQDTNATVFFIDRNKDRSAAIAAIKQYNNLHSEENIIIQYRDTTTQTLYQGKTQTSDLQALLNLIQSLGASDAVWSEWYRESQQQITGKIGQQEQTKNIVDIIALSWIILANMCMLISPLWIFQIWRQKA